MNVWMYGWMNVCMYECMNVSMYEWMNVWMNKWWINDVLVAFMHTRFSFLWSYTIRSTAVAWSASVLLSPEKAWGHRWAQIESWSAIDGKTVWEAESKENIRTVTTRERAAETHQSSWCHERTSNKQLQNHRINHWIAPSLQSQSTSPFHRAGFFGSGQIGCLVISWASHQNGIRKRGWLINLKWNDIMIKDMNRQVTPLSWPTNR